MATPTKKTAAKKKPAPKVIENAKATKETPPTHVIVPIDLANAAVQLIAAACHPNTPASQVNTIMQNLVQCPPVLK